MTILETKNLTKRFGGVHAVDHLSLSIEKGKIIGIVGPNGSGKTTLMNLLSGLMKVDGGSIVFAGKVELQKLKPNEIAFYGITRTFQTIRLFEQMTVLDNILVVLTERSAFGALFEKHSAYHLQKAKEVLERVRLWEKKNELAINLSYGQRKLLEIARALATSLSAGEDDVFLFDEPFAGLFPEMKKIVMTLIRELQQAGKTILLIEHDMALIREITDYVFVLDSGQLLAQGPPAEVLKKREVIEAYLGD